MYHKREQYALVLNVNGFQSAKFASCGNGHGVRCARIDS